MNTTDPTTHQLDSSIAMVWYKRDLRVQDHQPLMNALQNHQYVLPIFIIEPDYWKQSFASRRHWLFIRDCLVELDTELEKLGMGMIFRTGDAITEFEKIHHKYPFSTIYAHEECGGQWTYQRDISVQKWCKQVGVILREYPSNGVIRRLKNRDNWSKIRNKRMKEPIVCNSSKMRRVTIEKGTIPSQTDPIFGDAIVGTTQKGGRSYALKVLDDFLHNRVQSYLYSISKPLSSEMHCSRLSTHLTYGTLSVKEVLHRMDQEYTSGEKKWTRSLSAFRSRLSWRCHFIQKLEDQPSIEFFCMHPQFENLRKDQHNNDYFEAWKSGHTGYPLIDACMRSLAYTGWITFRMRAMLVSFASYHLWLDWRITGNYLAKLFTDFEPGIHFSQMQMQSGVTGINAVRMYNPIKQSQDHDLQGLFIKRWVAELRGVPVAWIHEPWKMPLETQKQSRCIIGSDYPSPIVNHQQAIAHARDCIKSVRKSDGFRDNARRVYQKLGSRKKVQKRQKYPSKSPQLELPID